MYKLVNGTKISFFENSSKIMHIDFLSDECIWYFSGSEDIIIKENDELFELLKALMSQQYEFDNNEVLHCYKDDDKLVWYSDCYYNPDDEWSRDSVSYLTIEYIDSCFKIKCIKPLDEIIDRKDKLHVIVFSPMGNGKYARNINTGLTLQDNFVINIYQKLLQKEKVKELHKKQM